MTCCTAKGWYIALSDKELEMYKNLDSPFREEIISAIDFERKTFLSRGELNGQDDIRPNECGLITDDGYCKIVLNCGDDALTHVCRTYPRTIVMKNDSFFSHVDLTCPVVAEYLFDDVPVVHEEYLNLPFVYETEKVDEEIFDFAINSRKFLEGMFHDIDGFMPGKMYVLFDFINIVINILESDSPDATRLYQATEKFSDVNILGDILEECEKINSSNLRKAMLAKVALTIIKDLVCDVEAVGIKDSHIKENVDYWLEDGLIEDLPSFYKYRDENFPKFLDKYMAFKVSFEWIKSDLLTSVKHIRVSYMMLFYIELAGMSAWKNNGGHLSAEEYSLIISSIERRVFHSSNAVNVLEEAIREVEEKAGYSLYMMPVY